MRYTPLLALLIGCTSLTDLPPEPKAYNDDFARTLQGIYGSQAELHAAINDQTSLIKRLHGETMAKLNAPLPGPVIEPPPEPLVIPEGRDTAADQAPASDGQIQAALDLLRLGCSDVFVDIGCGDGRVLRAALERGAGKAIGVEIDPEKADEARKRVRSAGLSQQITIITEDAADFDPADHGVTAGYAFMWPEQLDRLRPVLDQIPRVATPSHEIPGRQWTAKTPGQPVYVYRVNTAKTLSEQRVNTVNSGPPARPVAASAGVDVTVTTPRVRVGAVWGGRTYSRPVCNSRNCRMCNSIRMQLGR